MIEDLEGNSRQGSVSRMQEEGKLTYLEAATVAKSVETGRAFRRRIRRKAGGEGGSTPEGDSRVVSWRRRRQPSWKDRDLCRGCVQMDKKVQCRRKGRV